MAWQENRVEADGFSIRYLESGEGPVLACFHGGGGLQLSRSHELLAQRYRVLAFELPGFGESPPNERSRTLRELASTMRTALTRLGVERSHVWGTSFGGKLALWLTVDAPGRVEALVLESPAAIRPDAGSGAGGPGGSATSAPSPSAEALASLLYAHPERVAPAPPSSPEVLAKEQALVRRLIGPGREPQLEEAMADLEVPTLVLFGDEDRLTPAELGRHYRGLLPNCQFVIVHDAGHVIDSDRPEAFAAAVGEFLERREQYVVRRESGLLYP